MRRVQRKLDRVANGDCQMGDILGTVLTDGLEAVEAACAEALGDNVHSGESQMSEERDFVGAIAGSVDRANYNRSIREPSCGLPERRR